MSTPLRTGVAAWRPELIVLYDGDCGFCQRCATLLHRLDRHAVLRLVPLQAPPADIADMPSERELLETMHVRDGAGAWMRGAEAWVRIAALVPVLRPLAVAARFPPARWWSEVLYRLVARHRHRLSRLLGLESCAYRGPRG